MYLIPYIKSIVYVLAFDILYDNRQLALENNRTKTNKKVCFASYLIHLMMDIGITDNTRRSECTISAKEAQDLRFLPMRSRMALEMSNKSVWRSKSQLYPVRLVYVDS